MKCAMKPRIHSLLEWERCEETKVVNAELERERTDHLMNESNRLIEDTGDMKTRGIVDIEKKLEQRITDIKYWAKELDDKIGDTTREADKLEDYIRRVQRAIDGITEPLHIAENCLKARLARQECELVNDEVDKNLRKEIDLYNRILDLLKKTMAQAVEQLRLNRKAIYNLKADIALKYKAQSIDEYVKELKDNMRVKSFGKINQIHISPADWQDLTRRNIDEASEQIHNSVALRDLIDSILKQSSSDQQEQVTTTNLAFKRRIEMMYESKGRMEEHLQRILCDISRLEDNAAELMNAIEDKKHALDLAKSRIRTRAQRPGVENVDDAPAQRLLTEVDQLIRNIAALEHRLAQTQMELNLLRRSQLQLEEDIQRKEKALFIDSSECMSMRASISIGFY
ncbi:Tektin 1 [Cichlidogyrus casuarinus]|uniref:Tektin n=1 Tax=Cichlidogyrus casuarinus TaxID=1844966 RepID=A0ABD2Q6V2_9PLAT